MSYPAYGRVAGFSPLGDADHTSYMGVNDYQHGDLGGGIELEQRPRGYPTNPSYMASPQAMSGTFPTPPTMSGTFATPPTPLYDPARPDMHNKRGYSTASTVFPDDDQSYLHDPLNHIDTSHMANTFHPYKDNTGKQLRHIFITSLSRWLITFLLCAGYVLATYIWEKKGVVDETQKRTYNTITTGLSIALGINFSSALKDMALNMRWPILHGRKRNLVELDLLLKADSLTKLAKLAFVTRRPMVIIGCLLWLFINILAQVGIAMISLTYGFDPCDFAVLYNQGNVSIPDMRQFFPQENGTGASVQDQEYTAHVFGEAVYNYGVNEMTFLPVAGDIYQASAAMLYYSDSTPTLDFVFSDSPTDQALGPYSVYTKRRINATYSCDSHRVLQGGDGKNGTIMVENVGKVSVTTVPRSTTYFTNWPHKFFCGDRCSVVEAFEAFKDNPWYYKCNITLGETYNDPSNLSWVSDDMAKTAAASIAQIGYTDSFGQAAQIYPEDSPWGYSYTGNATEMGYRIGIFALATIAGASIYNPPTAYIGQAPYGGVYLHVGHKWSFYIIIGLICGCHLLFCIIVAFLANRVMVGPDGHLSMSLLLKPVADALEGVSGGVENKVFRNAKRKTTVRYENRNGRWGLHMIDR